jgi:hypothetical protein
VPAELHEQVALVLALGDQIAAMIGFKKDECDLCGPKAPDALACHKIIIALRREQWRLVYEIAGSLP